MTLLTPAQRRTARGLDPDDASFTTWLDRLHALMLVYDEDGLPAARSWLVRTGLSDDPRMRDVVEAALTAIPRGREKGEFVRPEARVLDSLRATLFDQIPAPTDAPVVTAPAALLDVGGDGSLSVAEALADDDE